VGQVWSVVRCGGQRSGVVVSGQLWSVVRCGGQRSVMVSGQLWSVVGWLVV